MPPIGRGGTANMTAEHFAAVVRKYAKNTPACLNCPPIVWDVVARDVAQTAALVRVFTAFPGVGGCYARMLTGAVCAGDAAPFVHGAPPPPPRAALRAPDADAAIGALRKHFVFVGLGGRYWTASVCLFHQVDGDNVARKDLVS